MLCWCTETAFSSLQCWIPQVRYILCIKVAGKQHTSAIIVSGLRPPLYSWIFFLNEANHCSSCFSSLISKSYLAVQPYYKRQKHEGNHEKLLRCRSPYINGHAHQEGQGYIFSWHFVNQVNDFSNSLYYKLVSRGGNIKCSWLTNAGESSYHETPQKVTFQ